MTATEPTAFNIVKIALICGGLVASGIVVMGIAAALAGILRALRKRRPPVADDRIFGYRFAIDGKPQTIVTIFDTAKDRDRAAALVDQVRRIYLSQTAMVCGDVADTIADHFAKTQRPDIAKEITSGAFYTEA